MRKMDELKTAAEKIKKSAIKKIGAPVAAIALGAATLAGCQMEPAESFTNYEAGPEVPDETESFIVVSVQHEILEDVPGDNTRDQNFIWRSVKTITIKAAGDESVFCKRSRVDANDLLFYLLDNGTDIVVEKGALDKADLNRKVWDKIVSINGVPRDFYESQHYQKLGWGGGNWLDFGSHGELDAKLLRPAKVLGIQDEGHFVEYLLDMNGDEMIQLNANSDKSYEYNGADRILRATKINPAHKEMIDQLHIGSNLFIDGRQIAFMDAESENRAFADRNGIDPSFMYRNITTPEYVDSYDGKKHNISGLFDYVWGQSTADKRDIKKTVAERSAAARGIAGDQPAPAPKADQKFLDAKKSARPKPAPAAKKSGIDIGLVLRDNGGR